MNSDDIIRMACEAGFNQRNPWSEVVVRHSNGSSVCILDRLETFATLVAAAEREVCAKEIDPTPGHVYDSIDLATRLRLAAAMRGSHLHPARQNE